jgi:predicted dehydrogenase
MLRAARDSGRVVQVGLHRRIGPHHVSGMKFLKSGAVGDVGMVRLFAHSAGGREFPAPNTEPPDGMNWDMWCGPAPLRPFNTKLHPGGWRNFLDYANGTLGDWGAHWLDQVLWWTDEQYPKRVFSSGGRPVAGPALINEKEQTTDAPDHQVATFEFEKFTCVWEHRHFAGNEAERHRIGAYFYGPGGTLHIGWRDGWTFYPAKGTDKLVHEDAQLQEPDGHNIKLLWADFLDAIVEKRSPAAGIEIAHRSSVLPLLGMLSWKLGRSIEWDGAKEQIVSDPAANRLLSRAYRTPWKYPEG